MVPRDQKSTSSQPVERCFALDLDPSLGEPQCRARRITGRLATTNLAGSHAAEAAATMQTKGLRSGEILADVYSRW
jgi:hypothetical protein